MARDAHHAAVEHHVSGDHEAAHEDAVEAHEHSTQAHGHSTDVHQKSVEHQ